MDHLIKPLSNFDIDEHFENDHLYAGCFSKDELPKKPEQKFYIVNMDNYTGIGTHWVLIYNCRPDVVYYFDPFGVESPVEIYNFILKIPKAAIMSIVDLQGLTSVACGYFCIYVVQELEKGRRFPDVLRDFGSPNKNDNVLAKYFKLGRSMKRGGTSGAGLISRLKDLKNFITDRIHFKPRTGPTKRFQTWLDNEGSRKVVKLEVGRSPIISGVRKVMNILSLGRFNKKAKELKYDDVYHQYLLVTFDDGTIRKVEKNHVVEEHPPTEDDLNKYLRFEIPIGKDTSMRELIQGAAKDDPHFWKYNARDNNCQEFTKKIVDRNHLLPLEGSEVAPQDSKALVDTLPAPVRPVHKVATDLAGVADRVIHGDGIVKIGLKEKRAILDGTADSLFLN